MSYNTTLKAVQSSINNKQHTLLLGFSGFGKTTMALNAFPDKTVVYGELAHICTGNFIPYNKQVIDIRKLVDDGVEYVFIIDDCTKILKPSNIDSWKNIVTSIIQKAEAVGGTTLFLGNLENDTTSIIPEDIFDCIITLDTDNTDQFVYLKEKYGTLFTSNEQALATMSPRTAEQYLFKELQKGKHFMKSLQFEAWQECGSNCDFCYLGKGNRYTPDELKLSALERIWRIINDPVTFETHDNLSYIGGEFFQGQLKNPQVREMFFKIMGKTAELLRNGTIKSSWLAATLTYGDEADLYQTLELFKDIKSNSPTDGFWLTSSYDTKGRFHTDEMEKHWWYHMENIAKLYPNIKFNITMILTNDLVSKYVNNEFSFKDFMKRAKCSLFFKQPSPGYYGVGQRDGVKKASEVLPWFFPKRSVFLQFLNKIYQEDHDLYVKLFNIQYRSDDLYRNFNDINHQMLLNIRHKDSNIEEEGKIPNKCGHLMEYAAYEDSDACMLCDKKTILEMSGI